MSNIAKFSWIEPGRLFMLARQTIFIVSLISVFAILIFVEVIPCTLDPTVFRFVSFARRSTKLVSSTPFLRLIAVLMYAVISCVARGRHVRWQQSTISLCERSNTQRGSFLR